MRKIYLFYILTCLSIALTGLTACSSPSFSLAPEKNVFRQNSASHSKTVDILWVVDNSASMQTSQTNIANNFSAFIDQFLNRGMQFRMAFTTTDAYLSQFSGNNQLSKFRDGSDAFGHSGVFVIDNNTPNMRDVFITNIMMGINGAGDERAFQSIRETLINPLNMGFLRPDSHLSIIIVSDEDDFSHNESTSIGGQYSNPALHSVDSYISFLDSFTSSIPTDRKYSVSAISILDQACFDILHANSSGQKIGVRYMDIVSKTGGIQASLCANFATELNKISGRIIELASQFYLNRVPKLETLVITINGIKVPESATDGWTYNAQNNSVTFHGTMVPQEGAVISVDFEPLTAR